MNDQFSRSTRLRYTATGALAALAMAGAIAGTAALAAKPTAKPHSHAGAVDGGATKAPASPVPSKTQAPQPPVNHQPFLDAVHQLVANGTITPAQALLVDQQIEAGRIDTDALTGFTQTQVEAVGQALANAKRALAPAVPRAQK